MTPTIDRSALERRAEVARERLANTLGALDRRGHDVMDLEFHVRRTVAPMALFVSGAALVAGILVAAAVKAVTRREAHPGRARVQALGEIWRHPERIAGHTERPAVVQIGRNVLVSVATFAASSLIRWALRRLVASVPALSRPPLPALP